MIATPCGPRAVPTGGAGVALPAGIWIFTTAVTFFLAMCRYSFRMQARERPTSLPVRRPQRQLARTLRLLELGDLAELHLDQRLAAEDVDQDLELHLVGVDLGDLAG